MIMASKIFLVTLLIMSRLSGLIAQEENWTHFRGSSLNGISQAQNPPAEWNESNIKWKAGIHGRGWSSPVVYGNQIWLTTATDDGKKLYAVCVDFESGDFIHDILVFERDSVIRKHDVNSYATPTPAIEDGFVYVHFGSMGTACIDTQSGSVVWTETQLKCDHIQGPGSSVLLYRELLILHFEGVDDRFLVALNKKDGEIVWKTHRQEEPYKALPWIGTKAYVTPLPVRVDNRDLIISNGSAIINAYDPKTGQEVWSVIRGAESTVAMPFSEDGVVYFETGFMKDDEGSFSELMAVNPSGSGDITDTHVLWSKRIPMLPLATPVIKNGLIYTVDTKRTMRCIDASNGEDVWNSRVSGHFNSSPIYASGKIYFSSTRGEVIVIEEGRDHKVLAENQLEGEIWATPSILRNALLIRTDKYLYRID